MSVKIYRGFKVNLPAHKVLPLLIDFHKSLESTEWYEQQFALTYVYFAITKTVDIFKLPLDIDEIRSEFKELWKDGFKYFVAVIPKKDYCLLILFTGNGFIVDKFYNRPEIQYFGYWDNTDPLSDVSNEEWEYRRKEWSCLSYGVPICKEALIFELFTSYEFPFLSYWWDYDPDKVRVNVARYLAKKLDLGMPYYQFRWKIPLLTKEVLFSDFRLRE